VVRGEDGGMVFYLIEELGVTIKTMPLCPTHANSAGTASHGSGIANMIQNLESLAQYHTILHFSTLF
jgi:hypothetical protein